MHQRENNSVVELVRQLEKLPGIGEKTAQKLAFHIINMKPEEVKALAIAIWNAKKKSKLCKVCCNITETEICKICSDPKRDRSIICVVEEPQDVATLEKVRKYKMLYHVLHGAISPLKGKYPENLTIDKLMARLADSHVKEVIIATDSDVDGETTASYLARLIKPMGIKVTRISKGIPIGGSLELCDEVTLLKAIEERSEI